MNNSDHVLTCPLCNARFLHVCNHKVNPSVFGFGLDFRLVARDCNRAADVATCPECFYSARYPDFEGHLSGQVKDLVRSRSYVSAFRACPEDSSQARGWRAAVSVLEGKGLNPRDLGIFSLRGSWMAREIGCLATEEELLGLADSYLDDALRRGLTKGDPGMVIYLLGEVNRRRGEFLRAKESLTFLGNNPRYRYAALLITVLIEEQDRTPYWCHYAPDRMEQHSPSFKGLFPALRSIPPRKVDFLPDELQPESDRTDEDDRKTF